MSDDLRDSLPALLNPHPDVTGLTGLSRNTVYERVKTGDIPHVRIGHLIKVPRDKLLRQLGLLDDEPEEATNVTPLRNVG